MLRAFHGRYVRRLDYVDRCAFGVILVRDSDDISDDSLQADFRAIFKLDSRPRFVGLPEPHPDAIVDLTIEGYPRLGSRHDSNFFNLGTMRTPGLGCQT